MRPLLRIRWIFLAISVLLCIVLWGMPHSIAEQIQNTATASADNLSDTVTSNTTDFTTEPAQLELLKTADRAAAEPGDTVVYRLVLSNNGGSAANDIQITDQLPLGINFLANSVQAALTSSGTTTTVSLTSVTTNQRTVTYRYGTLNPGETLTIVYAALITPDAVRGSGRNTAQESRSNLASYVMAIRPGILSDCGTLIGRVFVDLNFDGEQQSGERGVPNAVIFMDNGNRITTDANGLFSMANVLSGNRTGTLDLSSLPGYTLAPNLYFIERNSQSRLVRLEPGGLARMNFAVTPAYGEQ
ncbi:MAG: DUF11 domain-containing protein [Spirulina sp. SIO3F2]|nr:DUF11 domain-containing protein [Spirulina sp. SIO3F2]